MGIISTLSYTLDEDDIPSKVHDPSCSTVIQEVI